MSLFDCVCVNEQESFIEEDDTATFECDYDKNPTSLYQGIENHAWIPVLEFFETGRWSNGGLFFPKVEVVSAERQSRTWVTRFEDDGQVRWSQLPLHASLIFGAPFKIVAKLVDLYPQGVRCTDDQHRLPLHLAMKYNADDAIIDLLISSFPESLFTKDIRGSLPTELECEKKARSTIINKTIMITTKTVKKKYGIAVQGEMADLKDDLVLQSKLNQEMESQKRLAEKKYDQAQLELGDLRTKVMNLEQMLKAANIEKEVLMSRSSTITGPPPRSTFKRVSSVFRKKKSKKGTGDDETSTLASNGTGLHKSDTLGSQQNLTKFGVEQELQTPRNDIILAGTNGGSEGSTFAVNDSTKESKKLPTRGFLNEVPAVE